MGDLVAVQVTCSSTSMTSERRFPKDLTVASLKGKLELISGAAAAGMDLRLFDDRNVEVCRMDDNDAMIGAYPIADRMRIHVRFFCMCTKTKKQ